MSSDDRHGPGPAATCSSVVGLVASAGGVEALQVVLARVPRDLRAAVVVVLHQDPERPPGTLAAILGRRSALPVAVARDGEALQDGRVLVVPPGHHLLVTAERRASVFVAGDFPPNRPSGDLLLASMAGSLGPRAVAVVLSGTGHDGATGATAVHAGGGTVVATDESSSQQFGMPRATIERDDAVDRVVALQDVGELLGRIVARPDPGADAPS